jgi:hypothetical protein
VARLMTTVWPAASSPKPAKQTLQHHAALYLSLGADSHPFSSMVSSAQAKWRKTTTTGGVGYCSRHKGGRIYIRDSSLEAG